MDREVAAACGGKEVTGDVEQTQWRDEDGSKTVRSGEKGRMTVHSPSFAERSLIGEWQKIEL